MGEPAQLEQFSFMTARSAVPLRFLASAIRFDPPFHEPPSKRDNDRHRQQHPKPNQPYPAPLEPVNKIWRAANERAQSLLSSGVITRFAHRLRNAVKGPIVARVDLERRFEIAARFGPDRKSV